MNRCALTLCLIGLGVVVPSTASENNQDNKDSSTPRAHLLQETAIQSRPEVVIPEAHNLLSCVYDFACMVSAIHEGNLLIRQALDEASNKKY